MKDDITFFLVIAVALAGVVATSGMRLPETPAAAPQQARAVTEPEVRYLEPITVVGRPEPENVPDDRIAISLPSDHR